MDIQDKIEKLYDLIETMDEDGSKQVRKITKRFIKRDAVILDCAVGNSRLSLVDVIKAGRVICADVSGELRTKSRLSSFNIGNITVEPRNIFHLEDPDDTYDVVIAENVLLTLNAPEKAVKELYRVLKPGGRLLLPAFTPTDKSNKLLQKLYKISGYKSTEYSPAEYKAMLKNCGCGKLRTKTVDGFVPCCYAVIEKI